jgi:tetratricopeptide (TPR) repeat protein
MERLLSHRGVARVGLTAAILLFGVARAEPGTAPDAGSSQLRVELGPPRAPFLLGRDLVEFSKTSKTVYNISAGKGCSDVPLSEYAARTWPQQAPEIPTPTWVSRPGGKSEVVPYEHTREAISFLEKAEPLFAQNEFSEAAGFYRKALEVSPRDYLALLGLGDCAYQQRFLPEALDLYQRAQVSNPADLRSYFFQASVLTVQDQLDRALDAYSEALIRAPRRKTLCDAIESRSKKLGIDLHRELFHPHAFARQVGGEVQLCLDSVAAHWLGYGLCKAVWLGEPSHREKMTGSVDHHFTAAEEQECLRNLLAMYTADREGSKVPAEPELDRLNAIFKAGMLDELILFEMATRVLPQAALYVTEGQRKRLKEFARRFVLEPVAAAPAGGAR